MFKKRELRLVIDITVMGMDNSDHEGNTMFIKMQTKRVCYATVFYTVMSKQGIVGNLLQYAAGFFVPWVKT